MPASLTGVLPARLTEPSSVRDLASEAEIAAILRGECCRPADPSSFAYAAVRHAVAPLLVHAGAASLLPPQYAARLRDESRKQAAFTVVRERELDRVLAALHTDNLQVLLIKGAHLAGSCYPASHLRPRDDTDLFIAARHKDGVFATLARLGYTRQTVQTTDVVLGQVMFDRSGVAGAALDVHWRISRLELAARLFDFDAVASRAVCLPRVSAHARGPAPVDALALACLHQAVHHQGYDVLLWMYDVYLLLCSFNAQEVNAFVQMAVERRMTRICVAAIESSAVLFPTGAGGAILSRLSTIRQDEPSSALLVQRRAIDDLRMDLRALRGWRARARLVAGHLFPPPAYMRATYAPSSRAALPWLYAARFVRGVPRWRQRF